MNIHAGLGVAVREFPLKWKEGAELKSGSAPASSTPKG